VITSFRYELLNKTKIEKTLTEKYSKNEDDELERKMLGLGE
jgi:hypothetical protein